MSREKVKELLKRRSTRVGGVVLAAAIVFSGSMWAWKDSQTVGVPELVTYTDPVETVVIEDEETPLAKPKLSKTNATLKVGDSLTLTLKNNKKKTKWSSSNKKVAVVTSKGTITGKKPGNAKITAKVGSKKYTCKVTVQAPQTAQTVQATNKSTASTTTAATGTGSVFINKRQEPFSWSKVDSRVTNAFNTLGIKLITDPNANDNGRAYDGLFKAQTGTITVRVQNGTVYHELGHFLAFVANNYDMGSKFMSIFNAEKGLYSDYNKAYACSSPAEYFAESFCQYVLVGSELQSSRPQTYAAIEEALSMVTDAQVNAIQMVYGHLWK